MGADMMRSHPSHAVDRWEQMMEPDEVAAMLRLKALGWGVRRIAPRGGLLPPDPTGARPLPSSPLQRRGQAAGPAVSPAGALICTSRRRTYFAQEQRPCPPSRTPSRRSTNRAPSG